LFDSLNEFGDSGLEMNMSKHNLITFSVCSSSSYNSITAAKQNEM